MPTPSDSGQNEDSPKNSDAARRDQLAARLASLSPAQREQLKSRLAGQRGSPSQSSADDQATKQPAHYGDNAIAIVGMGCRFPGANNADEFWKLISDSTEAVGPVPSNRWDQDQFYDPTGRSPGKMSVNAIGAVEQVDQFDPAFFGIAPREASRMDPQQRLLLEVAWETLENAGVPAEAMRGSNTGVFIGIGGTDYSKVPSRYPNYFEQVDAHIGTGNALSIAAGRISYLFDFQGPSFIVDTACSSGLVAIHSAAVSLLRGESDAAIAGAVNLILSPETTIAFSKARMLSPDGHCRPFDADANGYVRGEGCGLVLLKRLADATRDGDRILGVLRGSAVNQDGRTSGITAPSGAAQKRVIRTAMKTAAVSQNDYTYIEAHGTGTPLGDPIELMALSETFRERDSELPAIRVGSVKANIGHTETVSGLAGLLKVLLMFDKQQIPAQANFQSINPNARLKTGTIQIAAKEQTWQPNRDGRLIAGVSSFGFGGTNSHLIVEKPIGPVSASRVDSVAKPPAFALPISARSDDALGAVAMQFSGLLEGADDDRLHDVCMTTTLHREAHPVRRFVFGETVDELQLALKSNNQNSVTGRRPAGRRTRIAALFTGQGSQYASMGEQLVQSLPAFAESIDQCAAIVDPLLPLGLKNIIAGETVRVGGELRDINHTSLAQPAICAIQCALVDLYRSVAVPFDVVAGHSIGEIAALYAARALTLDQAMLIATYRGEVMGDLPGGSSPDGSDAVGGMTALLTDAQTVADLIHSTGSQAVIATMNGPASTVVAGEKGAVDQLARAAEERDIAARPLNVSHAFHSPLMNAAVDPLRQKLSGLIGRIEVPRNVTFLSALTGEKCTSIDVDYWLRHLVQPVRFTDVMQELAKQDVDLAIELGPRPQLTGMLKRFCRGESLEPINAVAALDPKQPSYPNWLRSVGAAWCVGGKVDWRTLYQVYPFQRVSLPSYPFQRQRYWYDPPTMGSSGSGGDMLHPLLGSKQELASGETIFNAVYRDTDPNYLADHVVSGSVTVPAAAWIEVLRAAGQIAFEASGVDANMRLDDVQISRALFMTAGTPVAVQTHVSRVAGGRCKIQVSYRSDEASAAWQPCASATALKSELDCAGLNVAINADSTAIDVAPMYASLNDSGLQYGPHFQTLVNPRSDGEVATSSLRLADELGEPDRRCRLHPTLLDGALQLIATVVGEAGNGKTFLPVGVDSIQIGSGQSIATALVRRGASGQELQNASMITADVELLDQANEIVAVLRGVRLQSLQRQRSSAQTDPAQWIYVTQWNEITIAGPPANGSEPVEPIRVITDDSMREVCTNALVGCTFADDANHWVWLSPDVHSVDPSSVFDATRGLLETVQAASRRSPAPVLSVVTRGAFDVADTLVAPREISTSIAAMTRVAANENPGLKIQLLDIDAMNGKSGEVIQDWLRRNQSETELALRDGTLYCPRLTPQPRFLAANDATAEIGLPSGGSYRMRLDGSNRTEGIWVQRIARPQALAGEVAVNIQSVGLNFSDVLKSMGLYPGIKDDVVPLGIEFCGKLTALGDGAVAPPQGTRVMGVVPHGFASDDATNDYLVTPVPEHLDDEEAAALPIAFLTAQHALVHVGRLAKGESVLIHAGAGGVGLAAIQIAQLIGATIFTTAGHPTKRRLLAELGVPPENIFDSRDVSSIEAIRQRTENGVNVVLNSLPGEWIDASINLMAAHGRFLEIGKIDIYQNRPLGLLPFQDNLSYSAIDLDRLLRERPQHVRQLYSEITSAFQAGDYQPLPITSFRLEELPSSMRFMAARRNIGKIVVKPPRIQSDPIASRGIHLISGGSGAIAQGAAHRLIQRGAETIVLMARSPESEVASQLADWAKSQGAHCLYYQVDCCDAAAVRDLIANLEPEYGRIAGVIHAAGMLDDGLMYDMTAESLQKVLQPKVAGAVALGEATVDQPLKYFTMLGSVAAILGSPGQANYAAANGFLEGFARQRRSEGLPGSVVHWGPWGASSNALSDSSSGMADDAVRVKNLASRGLQMLRFEAAMDLLIDSAFGDSRETAAIVDADWSRMLSANSVDQLPSMLRQLKSDDGDSPVASGSSKDDALIAKLSSLESPERIDHLQLYFAKQIGRIMSMDPESIDPDQPLGSLGLDSLMAIELKNTIEARLDITLAISHFVDDPTLKSLSAAAGELL